MSSTWQEMVNTNLNGAFYVAREAYPDDARPEPAGRADHQQWVDLGLCAAAGGGALYGDESTRSPG
jgi:NAD(P)-dependent dehydrogenase (short-subunit alcohol dehydrogenase family)